MHSFSQKILDIVASEYGLELDSINNWLTYPPKKELGDFAFSCFGISKGKKLNPAEIATNLASVFNKESEFFYNSSNMGGYVNFFLKDDILIQELSKFNPNQDKENKNETVIVDYIGANAGKPLHIGHLCTPSQGQSIINIHKYLGYNVISDSHFGDWGGIFGKLITLFKIFMAYGGNNKGYLTLQELEIYKSLNKELLQTMQIINSSEPEINGKVISLSDFLKNKSEKGEIDLEYLLSGYQLITIFSERNDLIDNQCRKEFQYLARVLSDFNDKEQNLIHKTNISLWKQFTAKSIEGIEKQMELLNIHADYNIGESFYEGLNLPRPNNEDYPELQYNMKDIVKELLDKGIATKNEDGSIGVNFPEETKIPSCVLQKKDGTGLYLTSDLACIKYRLTNGWNPSKIIYHVDVRQQLHLKQAFWIAKKAWSELENIEIFHAYNGFIKLKEGAMSTRKGIVVFLEDLIKEGFERTKGILEGKGRSLSPENIQAITVAAIKYSYLSQDREKDVVFDWDKALSFEGNSGPYIQYAFVRASKIIKDPILSSGAKGNEVEESLESIKTDKFELSIFDKSLSKKLLEFDAKVLESAHKYKPHIIAQYCYELAGEFNSFYVNTPKILEEKNKNIKNFRLLLVSKTAETLKKGFELLAIDMPSEM